MRETYKVPNDNHIEELQCTDYDEKPHEGVDQLYALRRLPDIVIP